MAPSLRTLAVPSVCLLILFLGYTSQFLFYHLDPEPLTKQESAVFNILLAALWWSYERAVRVDPGRLPERLKAEEDRDEGTLDELNVGEGGGGGGHGRKGKWCLKCKAVKPARAHHCRQCGRCIPKMDHHCPWTSNCVSALTFPHFLRFILYTNLSLLLLLFFIFTRLYALYQTRNSPALYGPATWALIHLLLLTFTALITLLPLIILVVTATYSLLTNTTMIETWEIERHAALVDRARYLGGYVYGPGGVKVRIVKREFPFDVGFWRNTVLGMGTGNFLWWFVPWGGGPRNENVWGPWEENGFDEGEGGWPPVDPSKMVGREGWKRRGESEAQGPWVHEIGGECVEAFKRRQEIDHKRWEGAGIGKADSAGIKRQKERFQRAEEKEEEEEEDEYESEYEEGMDGEPGWMSSDGSRLRDFGVDEDAEEEVALRPVDEYDDDDVPLGELIRRRKAAQRVTDLRD